MPDPNVELLHFDIVPSGPWSYEFDDEDEQRFWGDWVAVEKNYFELLVHQPGYAENVQFVAGPLWKVYPHLAINDQIPEEAAKVAGQAMAGWLQVPAQYDMPGQPGVLVQMICSVRQAELSNYHTDDLEDLTRDAVVFNVRFQLGRSFDDFKFYSALSKFLASRGASTAKKIKIAFWEHDISENHILGNREDALAIPDIAKIGLSLAEQLVNVAVVALENRIMSSEERDRQKAMHASVATQEELNYLNDILSGSDNPL